MRILLAALLLVTACASRKAPVKNAGAPAGATEEKKSNDMKESTSGEGKGADDATKSKRSGDPCEGGE